MSQRIPVEGMAGSLRHNDLGLTRRWIRVGIVCTVLAMLVYMLAIALPMPDRLGRLLFWSFGPLLCVGAGGIYHFVKYHRDSIVLQIGTLFLVISGAVVTMMATMQGSLFTAFSGISLEGAPETTKQAYTLALKSGDALQLGVDVALDIFAMTSVVLLGIAMFGHPKLGKILGGVGVLIGLVGLAFNWYTFPQPPDTAGLVDVGPVLALWFLAVAIKMLCSRRWVVAQQLP